MRAKKERTDFFFVRFAKFRVSTLPANWEQKMEEETKAVDIKNK